MDCCSSRCQGLEATFDRAEAARKRDDYRRRGPARGTRLLLDALLARGVEGLTLLDIGGGVGAIQHELLRAGLAGAVHVDASSAYLEVCQEEAERQGHADRVRHVYGDFVLLAPELPPADIVTLDRVICCYPDMPALVGLSAARARHWYGLVFPRDGWWLRLVGGVVNFVERFRQAPLPFYIHRTAAVDALLRRNGLVRRFYRKTWLWQVMVYERVGALGD